MRSPCYNCKIRKEGCHSNNTEKDCDYPKFRAHMDKINHTRQEEIKTHVFEEAIVKSHYASCLNGKSKNK